MKNKLFLIILLIVALGLTACSFSNIGGGDGNINPLPVTGKPSYEGLDYNERQVLVRASSLDDLAGILEPYGSSIVQTFVAIDWALVTVPTNYTALSFIKELESKELILLGEPNLHWQLPEPNSSNFMWSLDTTEPEVDDYYKLWGMSSINAEKAWEITTGDEKVIIAIIDTGLDLDHPEFAEHTIIAPHNATDDGWSGGVKDVQGHGTHVAGTAAASGRYGRLAGVAWDCPIMPVRVMNIDQKIETSYLADAMIYVADYILDNPEYRAVINMSIGGRGYSYFFKDAIDYAYEAGVLLVAAAGNDYKRVLSYPAGYNGVVSVAASDPYDKRTDFSSMGFWNSVAAPGIKIWSSIPTYATGPKIPYAEMAGTSMASPHVCGAAALLLAKNPALTPLQIKNQLEETARPGAYGKKFGEELGYGIIDCEAMLGTLAPMKYGSLKVKTDVVYGLITVFDADGNMCYFGATGEGKEHNFYAMLPGTYTVTLSYQDKIHDRANVTISANGNETLLLETSN